MDFYDFFLKCFENDPKLGRKWCCMYAYNQNIITPVILNCYPRMMNNVIFYFTLFLILIEHFLNAQTKFHHIITTVMIHIILVIQHRNLWYFDSHNFFFKSCFIKANLVTSMRLLHPYVENTCTRFLVIANLET